MGERINPELLKKLKKDISSAGGSKLIRRENSNRNQEVEGLDNIFKKETRKKGFAIVPTFEKTGDIKTGRDKTKADVTFESKFGDVTVGGSKTKTPFGSGDAKKVEYKYRRSGDKGFADVGGGFRTTKDPFGEKSQDYYLKAGARYEFNEGGLTPKQSKELDYDGDGTIRADDLKAKREGKFSRGGRAAIRGFKFGGIF